jgi:hypothetical protein
VLRSNLYKKGKRKRFAVFFRHHRHFHLLILLKGRKSTAINVALGCNLPRSRHCHAAKSPAASSSKAAEKPAGEERRML